MTVIELWRKQSCNVCLDSDDPSSRIPGASFGIDGAEPSLYTEVGPLVLNGWQGMGTVEVPAGMASALEINPDDPEAYMSLFSEDADGDGYYFRLRPCTDPNVDFDFTSEEVTGSSVRPLILGKRPGRVTIAVFLVLEGNGPI